MERRASGLERVADHALERGLVERAKRHGRGHRFVSCGRGAKSAGTFGTYRPRLRILEPCLLPSLGCASLHAALAGQVGRACYSIPYLFIFL
jgi:hypothetical protein